MEIDKLLVSDWDGLVFINPFNLGESSFNLRKEIDIKKLESYNEKLDDKANMAVFEKNQENYLEQIENIISIIESEEIIDKNVLKKYIWLKEDPKTSRIKFDYFLR